LGLTKNRHEAAFFHLRLPALGRKHRFTEDDGTRKRGSEATAAAAKAAAKFRMQGGSGDAGRLAARFVLCLCSLTLMGMKGYAGGLGAIGV